MAIDGQVGNLALTEVLEELFGVSETMPASKGVGESDGEDGIESCGEAVDGCGPVGFECREGNVKRLNPAVGIGATGEEDEAFVQFLGKETGRGDEFFGRGCVVGTDDYELVLFHRMSVMFPFNSDSMLLWQRMRQV